MEPCGQLSEPLSSWGMPDVGRQTELQIDWRWRCNLSCPHSTSHTQPSLFDHPYQHTKRQRQPYVRWQAYRTEVCASHPLISPLMKGICQEWMTVLLSLPTGLSTRGPRVNAQAWVSASSLCLSVPPPLAPCRLYEWARQTSWLRDLFGGTGERAPGWSLTQAETNALLFFSLSLELFAIYDDRHKWFYAACHNSAHHPGAAGAQHYQTILSYPREVTDPKRGKGIHNSESATTAAQQILLNTDYVKRNTLNPNKNFSCNIQYILLCSMQYIRTTQAVWTWSFL